MRFWCYRIQMRFWCYRPSSPVFQSLVLPSSFSWIVETLHFALESSGAWSSVICDLLPNGHQTSSEVESKHLKTARLCRDLQLSVTPADNIWAFLFVLFPFSHNLSLLHFMKYRPVTDWKLSYKLGLWDASQRFTVWILPLVSLSCTMFFCPLYFLEIGI